ncbi:hypothetical protein GGF46_001004 [Coemansia sp. RSA 552]|nr:hypothetical protein GGF46_001004 [Coemansia sp. RSA 552]
MGGPGLEVVKFTFYMFMPIGFMVYFGGPGFYERYVADHVHTFNPPRKQRMPSEPAEISRTLEELKETRRQRKLMRERVLQEMAEEDGRPSTE